MRNLSEYTLQYTTQVCDPRVQAQPAQSSTRHGPLPQT